MVRRRNLRRISDDPSIDAFADGHLHRPLARPPMTPSGVRVGAVEQRLPSITRAGRGVESAVSQISQLSAGRSETVRTASQGSNSRLSRPPSSVSLRRRSNSITDLRQRPPSASHRRASAGTELDGTVVENLQEMGFSKDRIERACQELPVGTPPSLEVLLQVLFDTSAVSPPISRPSSSGAPQPVSSPTLGLRSTVVEELIEMGFARGYVKAVAPTIPVDSTLEYALDALLASETEQEAFAAAASSSSSCQEPLLSASAQTGDWGEGGAKAEDREHPELSPEAEAVFKQMLSLWVPGIPAGTASRVLRLTDAAVRQQLITDEQRAELHTELRGGDLGVVEDFLAIVGVRNEPGIPLQAGDASWECSICFSDQSELGWRCPEQHQFCHSCMQHHVDATAFPTCPHVGCSHELEEADLLALQVSSSRLEAFRQGKLRNAVDTLGLSSALARPDAEEEVVIRCSSVTCSNAAVISLGAPRCCFECPCGSPSVCTQCRQSPYHFRAACSQVQALRQSWLEWVSGGREQHFRFSVKFKQYQEKLENYDLRMEAHVKQAEALRTALARHQELERGEKWKADHCRLCPGCRRPIQKIDGCDSMICGQNYHGGNEQPGCGTKFSWSSALSYKAPENTFDARMPAAPNAPKSLDDPRGSGVFHPFVNCSICGSGGQGMAGLRFRCIHCENFSACSKCEPQLSELHSTDHVFEIMYESEYDWSDVVFPNETPVRIVRRGDKLPIDCNSSRGASLEGAFGCVTGFESFIRGSVKHRLAIARGEKVYGLYKVKLPGRGLVAVSAEHLEPLILSDVEARQLRAGSSPVLPP